MNIIEVEIFNKIFASIAEEMGIILAKSSFSSNIKERRDFSCAVFDAKGELAAQASHIPVHLGSMPKTLEHVLAHTDLSPGDTLITNDPFSGGSHLPDITLIEAVFDQKNARPLFYVVNRAHHADVGGMAPGSMGLVCSLADEGVLIPPTFLYRQGKLNHTFLKDFLGKVRNPSEREGDLRAQRASLNRGRIRLLELVHKHGSPKLFEILGQLKQYARRLMEHTLQQIPDGTYQFTDYLDDDGGDSAHIPISVDLTVKGKEVTADFSRSADQVMSPLNAVESVTISATIYVFQCLMGEGFPINQGTYQPVRIIARQGSIVNAAPPAPVAAGNVETSQRIVDTLFGALAQAVPGKIPAASCGSMNNVAIGSVDDDANDQYTYYETIGGGMGARPGLDGLNGVHTHMTNTMNTPIEVLEHTYPFQIERYCLRRNSGGRGRYQGGEGIVRTYRFLGNASVSLLTERRRISPYGLAGGEDSRLGENVLVTKGNKIKLPGKKSFTVDKGDTLAIKTPGGGGWGKPDMRY